MDHETMSWKDQRLPVHLMYKWEFLIIYAVYQGIHHAELRNKSNLHYNYFYTSSVSRTSQGYKWTIILKNELNFLLCVQSTVNIAQMSSMVKKLPISPPHISLVLSCVFMQTELYVKMSVSKCFYKVRARDPCWEYFSYQHFLTVFRHSDSGWKVAHCLQTYSICREAGRSSLSNQAEQDAIGK